MDKYKELKSYLKQTHEQMLSTREWWVREYYKDSDVTYSQIYNAIADIEHLMQGAISFAYYSEAINDQQFNEAWDDVSAMFSNCIDIVDTIIMNRPRAKEE